MAFNDRERVVALLVYLICLPDKNAMKISSRNRSMYMENTQSEDKQ